MITGGFDCCNANGVLIMFLLWPGSQVDVISLSMWATKPSILSNHFSISLSHGTAGAVAGSSEGYR
jgi:hypothetical protein